MKKTYGIIKQAALKFQYDALLMVWNFIKNNFFEIELFFLLSVMISLYRYVPYVNIIVSSLIVQVVVLFLFIRIFSVTLNYVIILTLGSFVVNFFFVLGKANAAADALANLQYVLLWYISIRLIKDLQTSR